MTTPSLPDAPWRHRPGLDALYTLLGAGDGDVRLVGGAVRDGLLGLPVADIDLATRLLPDEVLRRLEAARIKGVPTGIAHGTVTAVIDHRPVEITTLRSDVSTDGRRATVAFSTDWCADAARRDFTINALYADPASGAVQDYFGGLDDLAARAVRFIGDPVQRIAEDHLRILRYFRFLARFGTLPPDAAAYAACVDNATRLMALSRERIADELLKLFALANPAPVVALMIEGGVFAPILPEITHAGLARLNRLIAREGAAAIAAPSPIMRLASLLPADPIMGDKIGARLKLSNKARKRLISALTPPPAESAEALTFLLGREAAIDRMLLDDDRPVEDIGRIAQWSVPDFPISGRDLLLLGVDAGPDVARLLGRIRETWIAEGFPNQRRARLIAEGYVSDFLRTRQKS